MRVGLVSKGLLLKGDSNLELVLLCTNKPTVSLLKEVAEKLTVQLEVRHRTRYRLLILHHFREFSHLKWFFFWFLFFFF